MPDVLVLGIRGMPDVQGGVETHAQQLYPRLVRLGCRVEALVRSPFSPVRVQVFEGVRLRRLWSPTTPGLEVVIHSLLGVLYAGVVRPDVLHIHAIGPAIVTPLARLLGLKVVVTYHSTNYEHEKWGRAARLVFRLGEWVGMRLSHARIAVSPSQAAFITQRYSREVDLIPNGLPPLQPTTASDFPRRLGLEPGRYILHVGRMAAEKRQLDLIAAYAKALPPGWRLVLAGGLDDSLYVREVRDAAAAAGVVLAGYTAGEDLRQLYSHAGLFVLPSSHEGSPIALLEALGYGLPVIASDIPANRELELPAERVFPVGDVAALARLLASSVQQPRDPQADEQRRATVLRDYDWEAVAAKTAELYRRVAGR